MNVLIIMTDQQRKDSLGCYGNPVIRTPALDGLAARGARFDRRYVANPICMPNRMSIFTGQYVRNHGIWTNGLMFPGERRTMAHEFGEQGYQTASIGKIHFNPYGGGAGSVEAARRWAGVGDDFDWNGPYWGFAHVELTVGHVQPVAHYGRWFRRHGGTPEMLAVRPVSGAPNSGVRDMPPALHDSAFVAERSIAFLRGRDRSRPFFLVASFPDPHPPYDPPRDVASRYPAADMPAPAGSEADLATRPAHYLQAFQGAWKRSGAIPPRHPGGIGAAHRNELIAHTCAMVDLIDQNVARILACLRDEGLEHDTLVMFAPDHGNLLGEHGLWGKGPFFYEGLINTPLILAGPGIPAGVRIEGLLSDVDLAPTLYEMCGLRTPEYVDGLSQAAVLRDGGGAARRACLIEYRNGYGRSDVSSKVLVDDAGLKYVRYQTGECELTDLAADPDETVNLSDDGDYRERRRDMETRMLDMLLATESRWPEQVSPA